MFTLRKVVLIGLVSCVLGQEAAPVAPAPTAPATTTPTAPAAATPNTKFSPNPLAGITTNEKATAADKEKKQMLIPEYTSPQESHNLCCGPIPKPKVSSYLPRVPTMVDSLNPNCCGPIPQRALQGTLVAHGDDIVSAPPRAEGPVAQPPPYTPGLQAVPQAAAPQIVKADLSKTPIKAEPIAFLETDEELTVDVLRTRLNALKHPTWL